MTIEINFSLHVTDGIHIIIPQGCYSIRTLIQILISENNFIEQHFSRAFVGLLDVILDSDCNVLR